MGLISLDYISNTQALGHLRSGRNLGLISCAYISRTHCNSQLFSVVLCGLFHVNAPAQTPSIFIRLPRPRNERTLGPISHACISRTHANSQLFSVVLCGLFYMDTSAHTPSSGFRLPHSRTDVVNYCWEFDISHTPVNSQLLSGRIL